MRYIKINLEIPEYIAVILAHELDAACDTAYWGVYGIPGEEAPDMTLTAAARLAKLRETASLVHAAILHG